MSRGYDQYDRGGYPDRGDRGGYRGDYPNRGDSRYSRDYGYEMSRRQDYRNGDPGYDDYDDRRGRRGHDNAAYSPDDGPRGKGKGKQNDYIVEDSPKKGKKKAKDEYDPSRKGPIKNRSCTDIICCLLFFVFIIGLVVVAYFAYALGNPSALLYPQNSNGETCGFGNQKGRPYLFFFDLVQCARVGPGVVVNGCPTPQVCVSKCPDVNYAFFQSTFGDKSDMICKDGVDKTKDIHTLIIDQECAPYYLKSRSVVQRCLPIDDLLKLGESVLVDGKGNNVNLTGISGVINGTTLQKASQVFDIFLQAKQYGEKAIADVQTSWWMILIALCLACLISLIWIVLMRWIAGVMVWVTVVAFVFLFAGGAVFGIYMYFETKGSAETFSLHIAVIKMEFAKEKFYLGLGITAGIIFLIVFLIFLFLIQRIRIAIALIEEGSRAVGNMIFTLLWPIIPFVLQMLVISVWATIAVYLASVGRNQNTSAINVTFPNGTIDPTAVQKTNLIDLACDQEILPTTNTSLGDFCTKLRYNGGDYTIYLQIYNVFMFFWLVNFVVAFGQMTLAGAFASYYWAWDKKKDIPTFPLLGSLWRTLRYHLGTLAFGSLIIAIVQMIRVALEYIDHKLKGTENPVGKFFIKCLKCCFWCLEKFLKLLNKNAYILTAVYGKNFCMGAKKAFVLILENIVRVAVVDKVTNFLLFIAKLVVVGAVGVMSFFFFDGRISFLRTYTPALNFYFVPIIIIILATYIIASCFFSVYEMAVDTLFMCFLMDIDKNDGSPEKPYFMSKNLKKIMGKKNKPPPEHEEEDRHHRGKK
ncbi:choline transporter-like protein 2 [Haliotis cracherodii]|uniref:choline transporter-like protein 2 n=1 Tax=Haliotis cracherodii TaxID=6455 RepID=UPI0039E7E6F0